MPIHNKLVRDRIPEIIKSSGKTVITNILPEDKYLEALDRKLNEECAEYQDSKDIEELADILEVVLAIAEARGCPLEKPERVRKEKADKRGGFKDRIYLERVDE